MATVSKKKEALRCAVLSYFAGVHSIIELVERHQTGLPGQSSDEAQELRHAMLAADYERVFEQGHNLETLVEILNEEDLYPFGDDWPIDALTELAHKLILPKLSIESPEGVELRFRFKKGFKELLQEYAEGLESLSRQTSTLDHWLVLLLNSAFHAGTVVAQRSAEKGSLYEQAVPMLEDEMEPWSRYPQISDALDRQLRKETRRKTGLVSDLDY